MMGKMAEQIDAILFDVGGTLRRGINREFSEKVILCKQILGLIGLEADPANFTRLLDIRANAYRKWSRQELIELNEIGFWTQWMLPDLARGRVSSLAVDLNQIWRNADRVYQVLPDAKETIQGLFRAGYRLGLVSNTTSSLEAPNLLDELGLSGCFEAIVLSCQMCPARWGYANRGLKSSLKRQVAWGFDPNGAPILVTCRTGMLPLPAVLALKRQ